MGEAKRKRSLGDDLHSVSGYSEPTDAESISRAIYDAIVAHAAKQPTGFVDSQELGAALTFHLVQVLRAMPAHYKQREIDATVRAINEFAHLPFKPGEVQVMQEPGEA